MFLQQPTPAPSPKTPATLTEVFTELHNSLLRALPGMFRGVLVFLVFWIVAAVGRRVIALAAPRVRADTGVVLLLSRVYYYGILIFGTITALGATGMNVSALVTGLGLTGFALGFALKDVLSNLLSGIMLLLYRPFNIGDQIRMGEYEGRIETIRMRDTLVRAHDGRLIVIPNTKLITEVVVNNTQARQQGQEAGASGVATANPPRMAAASPAAAPESEEYWPPQQ
ncbi:MAG TPA: mechanosensitive ion channel domain-containing protein [Pyrinomonadaceae bacterium]|jgi:small-conductance mechanosensitive channel|nr:mechanosensitive ion channel domain-containing protein [Pyrinomonadaceae bacterium]